MAARPDWMKIYPALIETFFPGIDPGESAAIHLAKESKADFVLMDDADGRRIACSIGLSVIGTVGLLERAAEMNWLDLEDVFLKLKLETTFRVSDQFLGERLERFRHRHSGN